MSTLLSLPDDLFSKILKCIPAADLLRFRAVCQRFYAKDLEKNTVVRELRARDDAFILSEQYPPDSPIMFIFDFRQRVLAFERCATFAWEMTREAKWHEQLGHYCEEPGCKHLDLHSHIPELENGLRGGKHYLFFAQFTCNDKLLWQGFLRNYNPHSDRTNPMDDILRKAGGQFNDIVNVLGNEAGKEWLDVYRSHVTDSDIQLHLDTSNISNLTKDDVTSDLHVTLVSLTHSVRRPLIQSELHVHYSSHGFYEYFLRSPSLNHDSPSVDVFQDEQVTRESGANADDYAIPFLIWRSSCRPHSFSLLYKFVEFDEPDEYEDDEDDECD